MADELDPTTRSGVDDAALAVVARHALHDEELVATFAAGALDTDEERARAQSLVDRCSACRQLHDDLAAIRVAIRAEASFTASAPRDFRLTAEDARRLGGAVTARGLASKVRGLFAAAAAPLGASMAALGIVGLLVGSATFGGGAASAPLAIDASGSSAGPEVQGGLAGASPEPGPPKASDRTAYGPAASTLFSSLAPGGNSEPAEYAPGDAPNGLPWLFGASIALLIAGVGLLLIALRRGRRSGVRSQGP